MYTTWRSPVDQWWERHKKYTNQSSPAEQSWERHRDTQPKGLQWINDGKDTEIHNSEFSSEGRPREAEHAETTPLSLLVCTDSFASLGTSILRWLSMPRGTDSWPTVTLVHAFCFENNSWAYTVLFLLQPPSLPKVWGLLRRTCLPTPRELFIQTGSLEIVSQTIGEYVCKFNFKKPISWNCSVIPLVLFCLCWLVSWSLTRTSGICWLWVCPFFTHPSQPLRLITPAFWQ